MKIHEESEKPRLFQVRHKDTVRFFSRKSRAKDYRDFLNKDWHKQPTVYVEKGPEHWACPQPK